MGTTEDRKFNDRRYENNIQRKRLTKKKSRKPAQNTEHSEKSTSFYLNLEKQWGSQNAIKELIVDDKETTDQTHILEWMYKSILWNSF